MADANPVQYGNRPPGFYKAGTTAMKPHELPQPGVTGEMVAVRCECGAKVFKINSKPAVCPECKLEVK